MEFILINLFIGICQTAEPPFVAEVHGLNFGIEEVTPSTKSFWKLFHQGCKINMHHPLEISNPKKALDLQKAMSPWDTEKLLDKSTAHVAYISKGKLDKTIHYKNKDAKTMVYPIGTPCLPDSNISKEECESKSNGNPNDHLKV